MPKHYKKRVAYKRPVKRTVKQPYGGRMNDDCFVKVEIVKPLLAVNADTAFQYLRSRTEGNSGTEGYNFDLRDSPEWEYQRKLWGFYEIKGMSCATTLYPESYAATGDMFAGPFPNISA